MQPTPCIRAKPDNVARIGRNLRLEQYNVKHAAGSQTLGSTLWAITAASACLTPAHAAGPSGDAPQPCNDNSAQICADSHWPTLLGVQYTFIRQHQTTLDSSYQGKLSLDPKGDTESTHTIGFYFGWSLTDWAQVYLDAEKFMGAGDSGATGLGGLTNGDVVRGGAAGLPKVFYIARQYVRLMLPLNGGVAAKHMDSAQDQLPGSEAATRLEFKFGLMSASDDFDRNRYAGSTRTQFMNWSLWDNTAWDYAADTRGYTYGAVLGYIAPMWSLKYGAYLMPVKANGQELEDAPGRARSDNVELAISPSGTDGTIVRLLAYRNLARMGNYREALALAAETGTAPDIVADDRQGRHKYGFGLSIEQPLADDGETGVFARLGWNDGHTESFAFTEVDRLVSFGAQLSGAHWTRTDDRLGAALAIEGLSAPHRDYLAAGGNGFLLGDGALNYGHEQILEIYYNARLPWPWNESLSFFKNYPLKIQLTPDFQYVRDPGDNKDRGPVRFWGIRAHIEL
jgi:high affinity Mn2+ porin